MPVYKNNVGINSPSGGEGAFISVIISVRNEAKNIQFLLEDLAKQSYPKEFFEVIVADDDSTDDTVKIVESFAKFSDIMLIINKLPLKINNTSPKKRAINSSIEIAKGELITTTDGDCRVGEKWLETINDFYQKNDVQLISGAVTFFDSDRNDSFLQKIFTNFQIIEFSSLVGTGACAMFAGKPNMCNGANLTYRKTAFYEVGGFAGNEELASGDDEFLMHKIAKRFPEKVQFFKNQNIIVETQAHQSLKSFYNQRKRWASKWKHYDNTMTTALAIFIFLANLAVIVTTILYLSSYISSITLIIFLALKFSAEFVFLASIIKYLGRSKITWLIPFVQIVYPFYVVFFGLTAQGKGYEWKGRKLE